MRIPGLRQRPLLLAFLAFALGLAVGGIAVAAVAQQASRTYLAGSALTFRSEQDRLLSQAWRRGDAEAAVRHAGCALEVEHGEGAWAFNPSSQQWSLGMALTEVMIRRPNLVLEEKARPLEEGLARAELAVALERLGQQDSARRELANAARLMGNVDLAKVRAAGLESVDAWSKAQEKLHGK
jgi:hypothetical protein